MFSTFRSFAFLLILSAFLFCTTSGAVVHACLNDRDTDTLTEEAKALPGMVEVITGRFERNPALYYEMRIQRIMGELKANQAQLPLYDDIAVAYDRIGKDDDALAWMARKRLHLGNTTSKDSAVHEAWYRYYANTGTFRVHRWLHNGADRKRISEVKQARAEIAKAIEIKPTAHFGRETYQLQTMEWIISKGRKKTGGDPVELARYIASDSKHPVTEGLAGLVVLGNAWESVDIFNALAYWLTRTKRSNKLAYLAQLRALELIDSGHGSLIANMPGITIDGKAAPTGKESLRLRTQSMIWRGIAGKDRVKARYHVLRTEAEQWQKTRTDYMMVRLKAGHHPDTDPTFWNAWHPQPAPSLSTGYWPDLIDKFTAPSFIINAIFTAVFLFIVGSIIFLSVRGIVRWQRRQRLA